MIRLTSARPLKGLLAASILAFVLTGAAAQAQQQAGSRLAGTFSDWSVYTSGQGGAKVCYAVTQPKTRLPAGLNRDPAYLFVSSRPAEKVRNEISLVLGFPARPGQDAQAVIDGKSFPLVTKAENAWVKDTAQEAAVLAAFRSGSKLSIRSTSARGSSLTDEYSLSGVSAALQQLARECP
ncbi:invasion associated locus B family protein [Pseudochelatococcus lubricantis]|uniref:invasion associated locus B family protein n=1 Tax=Pseudochelatococcus lubricantis TaxID=1538102 RepID=UPI0035E7D477